MTTATKVYLDGAMGKQFGREWELFVQSPDEALRVIDANSPGVFSWVRTNMAIYAQYHVIVEYEDGRSEELSDDTYSVARKMTSIRFVPLTQGAGALGRIVVGAILIVGGVIFEQPWMINVGASLAIGGVIEMLSPRPSKGSSDKAGDNKTSYFFNGPTNTTGQGVPVQLIYGRVLAGSHAISAAITVDQVI